MLRLLRVIWYGHFEWLLTKNQPYQKALTLTFPTKNVEEKKNIHKTQSLFSRFTLTPTDAYWIIFFLARKKNFAFVHGCCSLLSLCSISTGRGSRRFANHWDYGKHGLKNKAQFCEQNARRVRQQTSESVSEWETNNEQYLKFIQIDTLNDLSVT